MRYMIDTANIEEIKDIIEFFPIEGVTTNPTLVSKEKIDVYKRQGLGRTNKGAKTAGAFEKVPPPQNFLADAPHPWGEGNRPIF